MNRAYRFPSLLFALLALLSITCINGLAQTTYTINGVSFSMQQVKQFAPVVTLHQFETYLPCSIEYLLQNATLSDDNTGQTILPNLGQNDLLTFNTPNY